MLRNASAFVTSHLPWILLAIVSAILLAVVFWKILAAFRPSLWRLAVASFLRKFLVAVILAVILLAVALSLLPKYKLFRDSVSEKAVNVKVGALEKCIQDNSKSGSISSEAADSCEMDAEKTSAPTTDTVHNNIDELKWLLSIIAGFAFLTALAQAAAAWIGVLTYEKQATAKLLEIDKVLESVKARYPVFYEVDAKRKEAHKILLGLMKEASKADDPEAIPTEAISWLDDFYRKLKPDERQLVLSIESFTSIDLHPASEGSQIENLKRFAVFYHSKFRYEKGMKVASFSDLDRAESYLRLALKESPNDFTLHNEMGNLYITIWEYVSQLPEKYPNYLEKALNEFDKSINYERRQQRAYYDLAYIKAVHLKDYDSACKELKIALQYRNWQRIAASNVLTGSILYNLGCYLSRIIARDHQGTLPISEIEAKEVVSALRRASKLIQVDSVVVQTDYWDTEGDIFGLYQKAAPELRVKLDLIGKALVREKPPQPVRKTIRGSIAEALLKSIKTRI